MKIKSNTSWVVLLLFIMSLLIVIVFFHICKSNPIIAVLTGLLLMTATLKYWIATGKVLIMDEKGCTVKFLCLKKTYSWDDFKVKKVEKGSYISYKNQYCECAFFSPRNVHKPKWMAPVDYSFWISRFSFVFVNFKNSNMSKIEKTLPAIYEVEKEEFIELMNKCDIMF